MSLGSKSLKRSRAPAWAWFLLGWYSGIVMATGWAVFA